MTESRKRLVNEVMAIILYNANDLWTSPGRRAISRYMMQTAMVDEITNKVDKANVHLNNLNKRMKQTLQQTRSADRFILDIILVVILLGVVGYIISMVS